jgi:DNA gyrase/topoisomerase IV subunit B
MAFNRNTSAQNNQAQDNDNWKAQGFINLYLPSKEEGKQRKIGAIPLRVSKAGEKQLLEWLQADPANAKKLAEKLIVDFQEAQASEKAVFALD